MIPATRQISSRSRKQTGLRLRRSSYPDRNHGTLGHDDLRYSSAASKIDVSSLRPFRSVVRLMI